MDATTARRNTTRRRAIVEALCLALEGINGQAPHRTSVPRVSSHPRPQYDHPSTVFSAEHAVLLCQSSRRAL